MSKMSDFYAKVSADAALKAEVEKALGGVELTEATDEQLTKVGEVAKKAGFDITVAEAKEYLNSSEADIGDDALDNVAGGVIKGNVNCSGSGSNNGAKDSTSASNGK